MSRCVRKVVTGAAAALALLAPGGCAVNPVSGRPELVMMSREKEIERGKEAVEQLREGGAILEEGELAAYISEIGERVAQESPRRDVEYSFGLVDDTAPNAFALPGGPIFVTRGLLPLLNSEDELANVLAHEVGHVAGRHHVRGDARRKLLVVPGLLGTLAAAATLGQGGAHLASVLTAGLITSHSREQESEADEVGQRLASGSGWDPLGMTSFLETLGRTEEHALGEVRKTTFLSTHPAPRERVAVTSDYAARLQSGAPAAAGEVLDREVFLHKLEGVVIGQDPEKGIFEEDGRTFLHADLGFRIRFPGEWATINMPSSVVALETDGSAQVVLELQPGEKHDPRKAARQFLRDEKKKRREAIEKKEDPGYELKVKRHQKRTFGKKRPREVYWLEGTVADGAGTFSVFFIPVHDHMFRVSCLMATVLYNGDYRTYCEATARSLRRIRRSERRRVMRTTLELTEARAGETIPALVERTGTPWSAEEAAIANGVATDQALEEGRLVKIAVARVYVPSEKPADKPESGEPSSPAEAEPASGGT